MKFDGIFNEICKVSTMKATAALSKFLHIPLEIEMKLDKISLSEGIDFFEDSDEMTVSLFLPITGRLSGFSFLFYPKPFALTICDILFNRAPGNTRELTELEISALSETANIALGNFLTTFSQSLQTDLLIHHVAVFNCAPLNIIHHQMKNTIQQKMEEAIQIKFDFSFIDLKGNFTIIFDQTEIIPIIYSVACISNVHSISKVLMK
ncbi:MAG: hypothetical protein EPO11_07370 [Gammaproteobacteria bacterium]|nr:MAG: hypothetical protein EPO11_07370 [Gammaproteobacteria bacterium]